MMRECAYIVVVPDSNARGLGLCSPCLILRSSNSVAVYVVAGELAADFCFLGCWLARPAQLSVIPQLTLRRRKGEILLH